MADTKSTRIGIFYDGGFFAHVSDYYLHHHERRARISIQGLHGLIRHEVASCEQTDTRFCHIVEAHYFRGRFSADDARRHDAQRTDGESTLYRERKFEDALIKAGVTPHFSPVFAADDGRPPREKGVDVWLALEAFDLAARKQLDVAVLVTGDGDYVPLVRKLNGLGTRVMITAWDLRMADRASTTRTAQALIDEATYPLMMGNLIDDRARRSDLRVANLFVPRPSAVVNPPPSSAVNPPPDANTPVATTAQGEAGADLDDVQPSDNASAIANATEDRYWNRPPRPYTPPEPSDPSIRELGYIANMPFGREFGFIEADAGGERLFFHQTWVEGCSFSELQPGDRVQFTPDSNPRDGRPVAMRVVKQMDHPQPMQPTQPMEMP